MPPSILPARAGERQGSGDASHDPEWSGRAGTSRRPLMSSRRRLGSSSRLSHRGRLLAAAGVRRPSGCSLPEQAFSWCMGGGAPAYRSPPPDLAGELRAAPLTRPGRAGAGSWASWRVDQGPGGPGYVSLVSASRARPAAPSLLGLACRRPAHDTALPSPRARSPDRAPAHLLVPWSRDDGQGV